MTDTVITKADLARELNLSRARISQLCQIGLPVRPDGKLNRSEALAWVKANHCPWRGGWWGDRRKKNKTVRPGRRQRAPMPEASMAGGMDLDSLNTDIDLASMTAGVDELLAEVSAGVDSLLADMEREEQAKRDAVLNGAYRQLLDRMVRASEVLPEVLLSMGVRDMGIVHGAADLFTTILFHLAGPFGDAAYDWAANDDIPVVAPKYAELAKRFGVEYDVDEAEKRADELCDELYQRLNELEDHEE